MTHEEMAARLNGREYRQEITKDEEAIAKAAGLVVVFGYSDDNVELVGAIDDEVGAYEGAVLRITDSGLLPAFESLDKDDEAEMEQYFLKKHETPRTIEALWCAEKGYSWTFKTEIPHSTFEIVEDFEPFCRGIVFALHAKAA